MVLDNVPVKALQIGDRQGTLKARRIPNNRWYDTDEVDENDQKGGKHDAALHKDQTGSL
jgi:hypothetical protein